MSHWDFITCNNKTEGGVFSILLYHKKCWTTKPQEEHEGSWAFRNLGLGDCKSKKDSFSFSSLWFSQNVDFITFSLQTSKFNLVGYMATYRSLGSHLLVLQPGSIHALVPPSLQDYQRAELYLSHCCTPWPIKHGQR